MAMVAAVAATPVAAAVPAVAMVAVTVVVAVGADAAHARTPATHKAARAVSPHKLAIRMHNPHVSSKHGPNMTTMPNPPAMSLQASPLQASPLGATVVASVAGVPLAAAVAAVADHARVAVVAGATGMVGRAVLARLTADKTSAYAAVHTLGRRAPELPAGAPSARLVSHVSQSLLEAQVPPADDMFIALGTTISVAGSQAAFRAVDLDAVLALSAREEVLQRLRR